MKKLRLLVLLLLPVTLTPANPMHDWETLDARATPQWFQDAKFGIFVHWGLYSVPAWGPTETESIYDKYAEWYWWKLKDKNSAVNAQFTEFHNQQYGPGFEYQDFAALFKAELFEPEKWARLFREAGARYVVLTSKHHEGFCLWPSEQAWNWNAMDVGPHRDLAGDLSAAVKSAGLHMGFYYSLYEWFNPLYREDVNLYVEQHMLPQMKDLVMRYEPDVFWTDGEWDHASSTWKSTEFLSWLFHESPVKDRVVVNDRWGSDTRGIHGGFYTTEYNLVNDREVTEGMEHPWEECRGIGTSFGYNRNEGLENYSSSRALIHLLIDKVSKGGNLLLNVGPTADGRIPVIMQQRLKDIGDWLDVNGEAIYGTRRWEDAPDLSNAGVCFTRKAGTLYVICREPGQRTIEISNVRPRSVTMLGSQERIVWSLENSVLQIEFPRVAPGEQPCEHAWVFKLEDAWE